MKILMVSSEVAPFASVGGLGDVVAALPKELAVLGHDVRVVVPFYGFLKPDASWRSWDVPLTVQLGSGRQERGKLWQTFLPGTSVPLYFIEYNKYFQRPEIYTSNHSDNNERFAFLSRASLDMCTYLRWIPDVIHCHDWPTALIPVYLNTTERERPLGRSASILTIHNLEHQGLFSKETLAFAGIPSSEYRADSLEALGAVNFLKGGLYHATKITTVSATYAEEIKTPQQGCGLNDVLRFRGADLIGVINGIDTKLWNPQTDPYLPAHYNSENRSGKALCKQALQEHYGLEVAPKTPIFCAIARLYPQKGLDLLADILPQLFAEMNIQVLLLGSGDPWLENTFKDLAKHYPQNLGVTIGYNARLSHLMQAGSDFFLMPSRFEPCGLSQLYAMRYGTPPIARATGGLRDTIECYQEGTGKGTGFLFDEPSTNGLYYTIGWACATYYDRPQEYQSLSRNGMRKDFSWSPSAKKYEKLYHWALDARRK